MQTQKSTFSSQRRTEVPTSLIKSKTQKKGKRLAETHTMWPGSWRYQKLKFKRTRAADTELQMYLQVDKLCSDKQAQRPEIPSYRACSLGIALVFGENKL